MKAACDSMLLGSLLKSAISRNLYPMPDPPYAHVSFTTVKRLLRDMPVIALCDNVSKVRIGNDFPRQAHGFQDLILAKTNSLDKRLCGLDLDDFKKGKDVKE